MTAEGDSTISLDYVAVCRAVGVRRVREVDPYDLEALEEAIREELAAGEPSVIVCRAVCRLVDRAPIASPAELEIECPGCGTCFELGCPALDGSSGQAVIDPSVCCGCALCVQLCPFCGLRIHGHGAAALEPA